MPFIPIEAYGSIQLLAIIHPMGSSSDTTLNGGGMSMGSSLPKFQEARNYGRGDTDGKLVILWRQRPVL